MELFFNSLWTGKKIKQHHIFKENGGKKTLLQDRFKGCFCSDKHTWATILWLRGPVLLPCSLLGVATHKQITYKTIRYEQVWGTTKLRSTAARQNKSRFTNSPALLWNQQGAIIWIQSIKSDTHTHTQTFALHKLSAIQHCGSSSTRSNQYLPPLPTHCHCPERYGVRERQTQRKKGERERSGKG